MKKALLLAICICVCNASFAQTYQQFAVASGFNADVIANGTGSSLTSTTTGMDNAEYALVAPDFQATVADPFPDAALPLSGDVENTAMPGLSFQLADYSSNNSLRLVEEGNLGSLFFSNPASATKIYLLAATGSGSATLGGIIHFDDGTTQTITSGVIPDWFFSDALPVIISGFGRVKRTTDIVENPDGDPRLYQFEIPILPANQLKLVSSIDLTKESAEEGVINVFAVSAKLLGTCPAPYNVQAQNVTFSSATIDWTNAVSIPAQGYEYVVTTGGEPGVGNLVTAGNATTSSVTINELQSGVQYCAYVRSQCSGTEMSEYVSTCFTPGQASATDPNDIPTLYNLTVDVNSTTTCPGILTVNIPAGYYINSVATSYDMQTALNGWMSEQRSQLVCNTTGNKENTITSGVGTTGGTYHYERSDIHIADNATGDVEFELRAWRAFGGADCNTDYNRVVANSWTVTVTMQNTLANKSFYKNDFGIFPNPANDVLHIAGNQVVSDLEVYNLFGQRVISAEPNSKSYDLSVSELSAGKYILKLVTADGVQTKSFLKN